MRFINDFLSLIFPRQCDACLQVLYRHEHWLCNHCRVRLPRGHYHLANDNELVRRMTGRADLQKASALFVFEKSGKVQRLLHAIKYKNAHDLAVHLGAYHANDLAATGYFNDIDVLVPIPLHPKKQRQRGYNQSACFAEGLASVLQKPVITDALKRTTHSGTQTKRNRFERWENVEGIFEVNSTALAGKHVLLVDDVITTGATIEAAWTVLHGAGAKVSVCCLAYARKRS
jgi:ComF family protein